MIQATAHNRAVDAALRIYERTLESVRADHLVYENLSRESDMLQVQGTELDLGEFDRIFLCAVGKASPSMAQAATDVLGDIDGGILVTKKGSSPPELLRSKLTCFEAGHPIPDEASFLAGKALLDFGSGLTSSDLVVFMLSGGTSALVEAPIQGISVEDLHKTTDFLLRSGQPIEVVNAIRSRLSRVKGGGLARAFAPATVVALVLSDVIGNDLATIGSGPFWTRRTPSDAAIRYAHSESLPETVREALRRPRGIELGPTATVQHHIIGSVSLAIQAAIKASENLGVEPLGYSDPLKGEAREMSRTIARHARTLLDRRSREPFCMVFGGETTVTLGQSFGKGGRCQEMALAIAPRLERLGGCGFLACGTDGTDGPTDAAGATADPQTVRRATQAGYSLQNALDGHTSYDYLKSSDNLVLTGPTSSNVNDIVLFVALD